MSKISVGKVVNTRGLRGEVKIYPYIDELDAFSEFSYLIVNEKKYDIRQVKFFKNMVFITFDGIDSIEMAEKLKNFDAFISEEDLPELSEEEFYIKDILGMDVVSDDGEYLGSIKDVFRTGANDVYEVTRENKKSMYLPAIKDVILSIDTKENKMTVHIIDGLDEI